MVPVLHTERLTLRGHRPDDLPACLAMWADPEVTRHIGGRPSSQEQVWSRILAYLGHWSWIGFGYWAIAERQTGAFVGELGFADFKREIEPRFDGLPELGWALTMSMQGKGYATEALRAVTRWGDQSLRSRRTVCLIAPDNLRSIRLAQKCGFSELRHTTYKQQPTIVFARPRPGSAPP